MVGFYLASQEKATKRALSRKDTLVQEPGLLGVFCQESRQTCGISNACDLTKPQPCLISRADKVAEEAATETQPFPVGAPSLFMCRFCRKLDVAFSSSIGLAYLHLGPTWPTTFDKGEAQGIKTVCEVHGRARALGWPGRVCESAAPFRLGPLQKEGRGGCERLGCYLCYNLRGTCWA